MKSTNLKAFDMLVYGLLLIGALNWGLIGLFDFNVVRAIFGEMTGITRLIYVIVGIAALYDILFVKAIWKRWGVHFKEPVRA